MKAAAQSAARCLALGLGLAGLASSCASGAGSVREGSGISASAPDWVRRGSRVKDGVVYGLGSASGIGNTSLARSTAANRGRAEIARILQVYSASLMRDYQASTTAGDFSASSEEQRVEQAIKTYSDGLLNGTEVREYWLDPINNTWYALVVLDHERADAAASLQARMGGGLSDWVRNHGAQVLEGLDQELNARVLQPAPAAPEHTATTDDPGTMEGGPQPAWVSGACDRSRHLCGVGVGASVADADAQARGELARIFVARVQAVQESFQSANLQIASRTGEQWSEAQEVSSHSLVSADKMVRFSQITERWQSDTGQAYSLAVIDKAQASSILREEIQALDQKILRGTEQARAEAQVVDRFRILRRVMAFEAQREAKNGDLQVIDGQGVPPAVPLATLLGLMDATQSELRFAVVVAGAGAARVRSCLEMALTERGYEFESMVADSVRAPMAGTFDVRLEAQIRAENLGRIGSSQVETAEAELVLRLVDAQRGETFGTVRGRERASRPTFQQAAATAAVKLCEQKVPDMMARLDQRFSR